MRAVPLRLWCFALISAGLQALPFSFTGAVPSWRRAFCWICLLPLLEAIAFIARQPRNLRWFHASAVGYLCGVAWYGLNCYWIEPTMHRYGGLPQPVSILILLLFALYLGLYHALFATLTYFAFRNLGRAAHLCLIPFLWVAVELARTQITGFPWDLLGYTQVDHLLLNRLAPVTGVMGLSLLVAAVNVLWFAYLSGAGATRRPSPLLAAATTLTLLLAVTPRWFAPAEDVQEAQAVLLQDNLRVGVATDATTEPAETRNQMLASFSALSAAPARGVTSQNQGTRPAVVLWPEAPTDFFDQDEAFRNVLRNVARQTGATVIAEDVSPAPADPDGTRHLYNSARMELPDGSDGARYDKMHLVPFGEYVPYKPLFFFAGQLVQDLPFVPGITQHTLESAGHHFGVFICYESIFGDEVRELTLGGAQVLVNLSDDGWYGDSSAPWEHLDMARMRAIENDRWLLRATNTGVTASIDPHGRIVSALPRHIRSSLAAPFAFREGLTFYARFGDWMGWLCAAVSALALGASFFLPRPVH